jgi:hypothetical protein
MNLILNRLKLLDRRRQQKARIVPRRCSACRFRLYLRNYHYSAMYIDFISG